MACHPVIRFGIGDGTFPLSGPPFGGWPVSLRLTGIPSKPMMSVRSSSQKVDVRRA
jgi:hypothetical protein